MIPLQCSVSLVVANLSVIIAFFFRITTEEGESRPGLTGDGEGLAPTTMQSYWTRSKRRTRNEGEKGTTPGLTSTFITVDGRIRERKDNNYIDSFALGTGAIGGGDPDGDADADGGSSTRKDSIEEDRCSKV